MGRPKKSRETKKPHGRPPNGYAKFIMDLSVGDAVSLRISLEQARRYTQDKRSWLCKSRPLGRYRLRPIDGGVIVERLPDLNPSVFGDILDQAFKESAFRYPNDRHSSAYVAFPRSSPFADFCAEKNVGFAAPRLWIIEIPEGRRAALDFAFVLEDHHIPCKVRTALRLAAFRFIRDHFAHLRSLAEPVPRQDARFVACVRDLDNLLVKFCRQQIEDLGYGFFSDNPNVPVWNRHPAPETPGALTPYGFFEDGEWLFGFNTEDDCEAFIHGMSDRHIDVVVRCYPT